jgi:hypothetical protein
MKPSETVLTRTPFGPTSFASPFEYVMRPPLAQALIICGLPYVPTSKTRVTRKAKLGDGTIIAVTFSTALEGQLPYGSDRSLQHFILARAVKTKSRYVGWETATEFLSAMNMQSGGKNRRDLRQRLKRIRGVTIGVERSGSRGVETEIMPVIRRSHLPSSLDKKMEKTGRPRLTGDELARNR